MQKCRCYEQLANLVFVNVTGVNILWWRKNSASANVAVITLAHTLQNTHPRLSLSFNLIIWNIWTLKSEETAHSPQLVFFSQAGNKQENMDPKSVLSV